MKVLCQPSDGVCVQCGRQVGSQEKRTCNAARYITPSPRDPLTCIHFIGPTGDSTETHKHCGCKTATAMTALAECDLHGTCTFIGRAKDERIPFCGDCQDYSPQQ